MPLEAAGRHTGQLATKGAHSGVIGGTYTLSFYYDFMLFFLDFSMF